MVDDAIRKVPGHGKAYAIEFNNGLSTWLVSLRGGGHAAGDPPMSIELFSGLTGDTGLDTMDLHCSFRHQKHDIGDTIRWCVEIVQVNELWGRKQQGVEVVPHVWQWRPARAPCVTAATLGPWTGAHQSQTRPARLPQSRHRPHFANDELTCDTPHNCQYLSAPHHNV